MKKRVLSVGNCGPDHRAISAMIEGQFTAEVVAVDTLQETLQQLRETPCDLVLVNRILDRDGSSGMEVIRAIKAAQDVAETPVMLITNFPEHQVAAQGMGALEGFGKKAIEAPETRARLATVLAS